MIAQGKRLPAYGGELIKLLRTGRTVGHLLIVIGWDAGKAFPRVCVPADLEAWELDLSFVRGIDCMAVHRGESVRAFDVAEIALRAGANRCPVFDMTARCLEATTDDVLAVRGTAVAA